MGTHMSSSIQEASLALNQTGADATAHGDDMSEPMSWREVRTSSLGILEL